MLLCFPSCHSPTLGRSPEQGAQGLNPCHSRERPWTGEGHTKAQVASCSPVSYKLFSSPSASEQTVQNCGSRMPQIPPGSPCPGCPAQGSLCSALVPDTAWGTLAHPGDSSGEGLPQSHLGLPQTRRTFWEIQAGIPDGCTPTLAFGHQGPPARKEDRPHTQAPHLPSLCLSTLSRRNGRTSTGR